MCTYVASVCMCVRKLVQACAYLCKCAHVHVCSSVCKHVCKCVQVCASVCECVQARAFAASVCTWLQECAHVCNTMQECAGTCSFMPVLQACAMACERMCVRMHLHVCASVHVCACMCMSACVYKGPYACVCKHVHGCMCLQGPICMQARAHGCKYVHVHASMCKHMQVCPNKTQRAGTAPRVGTHGWVLEARSVILPKSGGSAAVLHRRLGLFLNPLAPSDSHAACSPLLPGKFYATKIDVLEGTGRAARPRWGKVGCSLPTDGDPGLCKGENIAKPPPRWWFWGDAGAELPGSRTTG